MVQFQAESECEGRWEKNDVPARRQSSRQHESSLTQLFVPFKPSRDCMGPTHIEEDSPLYLVYQFRCSAHPETLSNNVSPNIQAPPDLVKVTHKITTPVTIHFLQDLETNRIRGTHTPIDLERGKGQLFSGVADLETEKKIKNIVMKPDCALKTLGTTFSPCHTLKPGVTIGQYASCSFAVAVCLFVSQRLQRVLLVFLPHYVG